LINYYLHFTKREKKSSKSGSMYSTQRPTTSKTASEH